MKKALAILALFISFVVGCSNPNPVEYNNKLMTVMNNNEKEMIDMNSAMNSQDYVKAESVRKVWSGKLEKSISELGKMASIKDDGGLKAAVTEGLNAYKQIATVEYKSLIELRTKEKNGDATVQPQIRTILEKMNNQFEVIGTKINAAGAEFEKKFAGKK